MATPEATTTIEASMRKLTKTKMCKFNLKGMCTKGAKCLFAHSADELQPLPDLRCIKVCKMLLQSGMCSDPSCTYAHKEEELRADPRCPAGQQGPPAPEVAAAAQPGSSHVRFWPPPGLGAEPDMAGGEAADDFKPLLGSPAYVPTRLAAGPWDCPLLLPVAAMGEEGEPRLSWAASGKPLSTGTPRGLHSDVMIDQEDGALRIGAECFSPDKHSAALIPDVPAKLTLPPLARALRSVRTSQSTLCSLSDLQP